MLYVAMRRCDSLGSPLVGKPPLDCGPCDAARVCPCCTGCHVAEEDELAMAQGASSTRNVLKPTTCYNNKQT